MDTKNQLTKVITGLVRFSYADAIWEPKAVEEGGEKKYSVALLIPKTDKKMKAELDAAVEAAREAGKSLWGGKIPTKLKLPIRDGDEEKPDDEAYAGHWFINATSKTKPGIVDKDTKPILDRDELYSGCYGRASINFFPFKNKSNGVACGLNNVQKLKDGEAFSGRASAEDDFGSAPAPVVDDTELDDLA